jgi:ribosomal protein S12 methylthiotransferase
MAKKVFMVSLGCPKNQVDSERALHALRRAGLEIVTDQDQADIIITNTCGFVNDAKEESIDTILELSRVKKERPDVLLGVMGCLSERYGDDLKSAMPEIDFIHGVADIPAMVKNLVPGSKAYPDPDSQDRIITTSPYWAYLKIAEGCSNKCSFCVIPQIRGPYKSVEMESVVKEAEGLAEQGVKELILVAQDTTLYGADLKMKNGLPRLLEKLSRIKKLEWIRVMYMYPALVTDELLSVFAGEGKVVPYFDIPLQHASTNLLKSMGRPETETSIRDMLDRIRQKLPNSAIRTAFIVGFPGEKAEDFKTLLRLVEDARFDHMGAFKFSPEEGSAAFTMSGAVPRKKAEERYGLLMTAQRDISRAKLEEKIGSVAEVLVDIQDTEEMLVAGRLATQAPKIDGCVILDGVEAAPGSIVKVKITGASDYDLVGGEL